MSEQNTNSRLEPVTDERSWSRQLRRDRRAQMSALEEDAGMPGPGAAQANRIAAASAFGVTRDLQQRGGIRGRFGNFVQGRVLQGMMASGVGGEASVSDTAQNDGSSETMGSGDGSSQMKSADEGGSGGSKTEQQLQRDTSAYESMSSKRLAKLRTKAESQAQGGPKGKSTADKKEKGKEIAKDIEAEVKKRALKLTRFTIPLITAWRFLVGEFVTPIVDIGMVHTYAIASMLGFTMYAPKKPALWEWLVLLSLDAFIFTALLLIVVLFIGLAEGAACASNPLCAIKLIRDFGSYFF